jgi:all-trans-retinol dehydrogenase (NAD+)
MMQRLAGKRALITGAAQGIGFALASQLAKEGVQLLLTDTNVEALSRAKRELEKFGFDCRNYPLDVTDIEQIQGLRDTLRSESIAIDILVNNAGIVHGGAFVDVPLEKHLLTYRVNTEGVIAMTHAFLPQMIERLEAQVINIASASGFIALPKGATYASSKWAVIGFSESLRVELRRAGHRHIGVTTVCPGYVSTGMFDGVKQPLLTPMLSARGLSRKVVCAVKKGDTLVMEPWMVKLTPALMGILPRQATDLLASLIGASASMESWRGHC